MKFHRIKVKQIKKLCCMDNNSLQKYLIQTLSSFGYKNIISNDFYTIAEGKIPICLIAHIDTVFIHPPHIENFLFDSQKQILWNPKGSGFDDRAGIWAILELLKYGFRPHIIFTNYEEQGGIGSHQLIADFNKIPFENCKALIQLDRANEKDMVFYNCINQDFEKYIGKYGFNYAEGTFTDISILVPAWKIVGVNVSVGYVNEHSILEMLHINWFIDTIHKISAILYDIDKMPYFEYKTYTKIIDFKHCLICGNSNNLINVIDEGINFCLCETCYNQCYGHL